MKKSKEENRKKKKRRFPKPDYVVRVLCTQNGPAHRAARSLRLCEAPAV